MRIRPVDEDDAPNWLRLRCGLWPGDETEHALNIRRFFDGTLREPTRVLVADDAGDLVGFVELSIRAYAEGCHSDHVGYVEGWYVASAARGRGVGRALIAAAEDWARGEGCEELASDAELTNSSSDCAHKACGFKETGQIRCYRKAL